MLIDFSEDDLTVLRNWHHLLVLEKPTALSPEDQAMRVRLDNLARLGVDRSDLNPRQREYLEFIEEFITLNGLPPTYREIMSGMGLSSPAPVQFAIEQLIEKGYLKRHPFARTRFLQLAS